MAKRPTKLLPAPAPSEQIVMHGISPELTGFMEMARKAHALDLLAEHHALLDKVNSDIKELAGKTRGKADGGQIMSQYLGQKQALERSIQLIWATQKRAA